MLRPSRPMIRPFISSLGRWTTVTVCSAVWSAATRCIAVTMISRALSWASSRARRSIDRASLTASCSASSRIASSRIPLASSADRPETCSRAATRSWLSRESSSRWCSISRSRSLILRDFSSSMSARWSSCSSRLRRRRSRPWSSPRLARASSSASRCRRSFSSFASRIMSFCWARASATIRPALSWADLTLWLDHTPRTRKPTATPTTPATIAVAATTSSIFGSSPAAGLVGRGRLKCSTRATRPPADRLGSGPGGHSALPGLSRWLRLARKRPSGPHPVVELAYNLPPEPAGGLPGP